MATAASSAVANLAPSLIVPGAAKSGTSTLYAYLAQHPDIEMATVKEPHVYSFEERYARRFDNTFPLSFPRLFERDAAPLYRSEASTTYMVSPEAPHRIFGDAPDAKLIFILRNPVDRIISHYNWLRTFDVPMQPFRQEIEADRAVPFDAHCNFGGNYKCYYGFSSYGTHLRRYLTVFPRERVHVITFEALTRAPIKAVKSCFDFLGLAMPAHWNHEHENRTIPRQIDARPEAVRRLMQLTPRAALRLVRAAPGLRRAYRSIFYRKIPSYKPTEVERHWLADELQAEVELLFTEVGARFPEWIEFPA